MKIRRSLISMRAGYAIWIVVALIALIAGAFLFFGGQTVTTVNIAVNPQTNGATSEVSGEPGPSVPDPSASNQPATNLLTSSRPIPVEESLLAQLANVSTNAIQRQADVDRIASSIPNEQLERALNSIWEESKQGGAARDLAQQLLRRWGAEVPALAAAWLFHKEAGPLKEESSIAVATVWANKEVAVAAEWVRQWPEEQQESGLLAIAHEAARSSPKEALTLAAELPPGDRRDDVIRSAVGNWAASDSKAPLAWAAGMEASPLRDEIVGTVSLVLSETDPSGAAELAIKALEPGKRQNDVVVGVVQRWAQKDPQQASAWVNAFPDGPLRVSAAENLTQIWAEQSTSDTADWLNELPPGAARDAAVTVFAGRLAADSPEAATTWVESIGDGELRDQQTRSLAERWLAIDRAAARTWIEHSSLSAEAKAALLAKPSPPDPAEQK